MQSEHRSVCLFPNKWETFSLIWPLIVFFACDIAYFAGIGESKASKDLILFCAGFFFLNVVHNIFSLYLIVLFPEARAWLKSYSLYERTLMFLKWAGLFVLLVAVFYKLISAPGPVPVLAAYAIAVISTYNHCLWQFRGLASAYNQISVRQIKLSGAQWIEQRSRADTETHLFRAMTIAGCMDLWFQLQPETPYRVWFFTIQLLIFGLILLNSLQFPNAANSNKTIYLARLAFFPLAAIDIKFLLGVQFIHGVEHTMLFFKMWRNSHIKNERSRLFIWCVLVPLTIFFGLLSAFRRQSGFGNELILAFPYLRNIIISIAALSTAFNFLHFYLDREIFRMRDARVRENIGPLLIDNSETSIL